MDSSEEKPEVSKMKAPVDLLNCFVLDIAVVFLLITLQSLQTVKSDIPVYCKNRANLPSMQYICIDNGELVVIS